MAPSPTAAAPAPDRSATASAGAVTGDRGAAFWAKQARVTDVAGRLVAASRKQARQGGYAGVITNPEKSALTLYWKGTVPAAVRQATTSDRRVKVTVAPAPYTRHQLTVARDRVVERRSALPGKLTSVGPSPDGGGLLIGMAPVGGKAVAARQSAAFARGVTGITGGVKVTRVETSSPELSVGKVPAGQNPESFVGRAGGRRGAQAYGGAGWVFNNGREYCSTGFAARYWQTTASRMVTAAHCGSHGANAHSPEYPTNRPFGRVMIQRFNRDMGLLYVASNSDPGFFKGYIWWGSWVGNPSHQQLRKVTGVNGNFVGNKVCSSGAPTGTVCDIRIEALDQTIPISTPNGALVHHGVKVRNRNHYPNHRSIPVWGQGDSGGPIVQEDGAGHVHGLGTISASDLAYRTDCQGQPGRNCSSVGWYGALDSYSQYENIDILHG
ncbi:peptidase [Streptomyces sp. NPDC057638]|uniref:peptidase n=1 Tax=Streptomyces sp. NPDC057638 TaxID=3346190 RepID=UPI0036A00B2E